MLVGIVGFFLYSNFGPYGPATLPVLISQLIGISFTAVIGRYCRKLHASKSVPVPGIIILAIAGFLSALSYHMVVDVVDAYIYQPFWPRLIGGVLFSLITIVSNIIIFALMKRGLIFLYKREKAGLINV